MCNVLGLCLRCLDSSSKKMYGVFIFIVPMNDDPFYAI